MALKIRLARGGAKKRPFYRIVVCNSRDPRDGKFIEKIGSYDPFLPNDSEQRIVLKTDRAKYWMSVGAKPTEKVEFFLSTVGLCETPVRRDRPIKSAPGKKAQERLKAAASSAAE